MKTGRPRLDPFEVHGNIRTYCRGCRCVPCTDVNRMASKQHRDKIKARRLAAAAEALKSPIQKLREQWQHEHN